MWIKGKRMSPSLVVLMLTPYGYHSWERKKRTMVGIFIAIEVQCRLIDVKLRYH
jgi:hypothetical protein